MEKTTHFAPLSLCHSSPPDRFEAQVNGKAFISTHVSALACLRTELEGARSCRIWKIHAVGKVAGRRTVFGFFMDQTLTPGSYDLVRDARLTVVYHLTPKQHAQVFHSRDFQAGTLTLLDCNGDTGRLRGTFEFAMPAVGFVVSSGAFDLLCRPEKKQP